MTTPTTPRPIAGWLWLALMIAAVALFWIAAARMDVNVAPVATTTVLIGSLAIQWLALRMLVTTTDSRP